MWNWHTKRARAPKCAILEEWRGALRLSFDILIQLKEMIKAALILLIASVPSIVCATGAVILLLNGIGFWGWFLAIAVLTNPVIVGIKITLPD